MKSFEARMIGKSIRSVERNEPGFGISVLFTDGTGLVVHTEVSLRMSDTGAGIERVTSTKQEVILHLGEHDFLAISTDRQKYDTVELFVYQDADGTFFVEN